MMSHYIPAVFLLLAPLLCQSAFNNASDPRWCWSDNCVQEKSPGSICYYPAGGETNATACTGGHAQDTAHQAVVNTHLSQGLSIAYYALITNERLGGVNYSLSTNLPPNTTVTVCLSGQLGSDSAWQTLCTPADYDNDITFPGAYCQLAVGQHYVSDGCYTPMPNSTSTNSTSTNQNTSNSSASTSGGGLSQSDVVTIGTSVPLGTLGVLFAGIGVWAAIDPRSCKRLMRKLFCCGGVDHRGVRASTNNDETPKCSYDFGVGQ